MANVSNVTAGKPKIGGAIFRAPAGATLPTSTADTLDNAFVQLGYVSEDGLTNSNSIESAEIKAWGGETVLNPQTSKTDTFAFKLIEALDVNVLKAIYNDSNVTESNDEVTVKVNAAEAVEASWVIDMIMRGGKAKRIVIPSAKVTELGDIVYNDTDAVGYEVTITAYADSLGQTHYEYIK